MTTPAPYLLRRGSRPLLISMPHVGTHVPADIAGKLNDKGNTLADTDWHLPRLYAFAEAMDVSILIATHSRYVIDVNRPPDNQNLYPGQDTPGLCAPDDFDKEAVYRDGCLPDEAEILRRREQYWRPYHEALQGELDRLHALHPQIALWDAHSIRSVLPRFFEGKLPDLNLGSNGNRSCHPRLAERLLEIARTAPDYSSILNGRFTGGYITRHYGQPEQGIHAIQLEMCQSIYMEETLPFAYDESRAGKLQPLLQRMLESVLDFVEAR